MENSPSPTTTDETVTFKRSHFYSVMVVFAFAVGILVGYMAWGRATAIPIVAQQQNPPADNSGQINTEELMQYLVKQARHIDGDDNADIIIVEFSDYQ